MNSYYTFALKSILGITLIILSGCSIVQWLPSSACEYVSYERVNNKVEVVASCTL